MTPRPQLPASAIDNAEIMKSLDHDSFVSAAIQSSLNVGADFTANVPTAPALLGGATNWNSGKGVSLQ